MRRPAYTPTRCPPTATQIFFRAWLLTAVERAGGSPLSALAASSALFGLYKVPIASVLSGDDGHRMLLYETLGAYLAFLYQQSGGSLAFVAITHVTFNLAVLSLGAAQLAGALPFQ